MELKMTYDWKFNTAEPDGMMITMELLQLRDNSVEISLTMQSDKSHQVNYFKNIFEDGQ